MSIGHNNPPEPVELFAGKVALYSEHAQALGPVTEANAQAYRDAIGFGGDLTKEIEEQHAQEKRPILDAGKRIDGAYKPLIAQAETIKIGIRDRLRSWMVAREAEAKRIADEKARALREAEEAARKAAEAEALEAEEDDLFLAATAAPAPDLQAVAVEAKTAEMQAMASARVGSDAGGFNALGLKTKRRAVIADPKALAAYYLTKQNSDLLALLEKLANADIRHAKGAPMVLPGVEIVEERVL